MLDYLARIPSGPYRLMMTLEQLLSQKRASVLKRWFDLIAENHPSATSPFSRGNDEFANPEAHITARETDALYGELLQDCMDPTKVCISLDNILRIKAVQELSPGQAVSFIFLLKQAITEELGREIEKSRLGQWFEFEARIDKLASMAFDIYMQCREKIYQLRIKEIKANQEGIFGLLDFGEPSGTKRTEAVK